MTRAPARRSSLRSSLLGWARGRLGGRAAGWATGAVIAAGLALGGGGCGRFGKGARTPSGPTSQSETNRYISRAIRSSSEGVILLPSQRAEQVYELPRLNEIAQALRAPAARCFLMRAIETMERVPNSELGFAHVPEGQLKIRVRIAPSGEALRTEVLESGFLDEEMEPCLRQMLQDQRWPPNKTGNSHYIDVVYWVSLGMQKGADSDAMANHLRREQVTAGRRAKACLQGRVDAGRYEIGGLNLVDREGATMVNRIDTGELPEAIRSCLATAFRDVRLPRDPDAFVRPVSPKVTFEIDREGTVSVEGEQWLELVELEERARLDAERQALAADEAPDLIDELPPRRPPQEGVVEEPATDPAAHAPSEQPNEKPAAPAGDPGKGGLRLELGGPRRGDDA